MEATQLTHSTSGKCPSCGLGRWVTCEDPDQGIYRCISCKISFTTDTPLITCMTCLYRITKERCEGCLDHKEVNGEPVDGYLYRHHTPGNGLKRGEDRRRHLEEQLKAKPYALKYKGFWNTVNAEPPGDWIKIWASDWNKDHWGFYAYIAIDNYTQDLEAINDLITLLNWRDGDVYIELINLPKKDAYAETAEGIKEYPTPLGRFYKELCDSDGFDHSEILRPEYWAQHFNR